MLDYLIVIIIAFFLFIFLAIIRFFFTQKVNEKPTKESKVLKKKASLLVCPICFHKRNRGEKVYAKSLSLPDGKIRVEVHGCDFCIPKKRNCPRCEKPLGKNDIVFGILIKKNINGLSTSNQENIQLKDRLHIEGCMNCFRR